MNYLSDGIIEAIKLIFSFDRELFQVVFNSLMFAGVSTFIASLIGVPLGFVFGLSNNLLSRVVLIISNALMSLPTVVVGLLGYTLLSRQGAFGQFGLLFSPAAIIIGQVILILPIVLSLSAASVKHNSAEIIKTARSLGANRTQSYLALLSEKKILLFTLLGTAFGRVFAEVGISMMLGGNIRGYTRTITTAIALETSKGEFALGLALGTILLSIAFLLQFSFRRYNNMRDRNVPS